MARRPRPQLTARQAYDWEQRLVYLLAQLRDFHEQLGVVVHKSDEPSDLDLLPYFLAIHRESLWIRDAGSFWVNRSHPWDEMGRLVGVADATLQSRVAVWSEREGLK